MGLPDFLKLRGTDAQSSRVQDGVAAQLTPLSRALASTPMMGAAPPAWVRPDVLNGYAAVAGGAVAAFHKDALSYVHAKGALSHAAGCAGGTVLYVLPLGSRPKEQIVFAVRGVGAVAQAIVIEADGRVRNDQALAAGDTIFPCFTFLAEQ